MSDDIKHVTDYIFFLSGRLHICARALWVQHSPTAVALWTSFLLSHAPLQQCWAESIGYKIRESYSSV